MGRIKNVSVKALANQLIKDNNSKFTDDFEKNKTVLKHLKKIKSKKVRNVVAGYITVKIKQVKKSSLA